MDDKLIFCTVIDFSQHTTSVWNHDESELIAGTITLQVEVEIDGILKDKLEFVIPSEKVFLPDGSFTAFTSARAFGSEVISKNKYNTISVSYVAKLRGDLRLGRAELSIFSSEENFMAGFDIEFHFSDGQELLEFAVYLNAFAELCVEQDKSALAERFLDMASKTYEDIQKFLKEKGAKALKPDQELVEPDLDWLKGAMAGDLELPDGSYVLRDDSITPDTMADVLEKLRADLNEPQAREI